MERLDFNVYWDDDAKFNNDESLPESIRALLIGSSNCGKTSLLFKLLLGKDVIDYNSLYIFSKSLNQKVYEILIEGFKNKLSKEIVRAIFEDQKQIKKTFKGYTIKEICSEIADNIKPEKQGISINVFNSKNNIPNPSELDSSKKNLIIFDDVLLENQDIIESYYTKGRHNSCQAFYISQAFFKIPKGTVRDNANLLILFKQNDLDVQNIHRQIVFNDMDLETFRRLCKKVWSTKYKFLVINKDQEDLNLKYTDCFTTGVKDILPDFIYYK